MSRYLTLETGAVTVDWVVLTAGLVGLGLATMSVVGTGVQDTSTDIQEQLSDNNVIFAGFTRPGGVDFDFETMDGVQQAYIRDEATVSVSDALGSVSGSNALVISFGGQTEHQGFRITPDQSELVVGGTYRMSYWARTDGDTVNLDFSHQSGSGQATEVTHRQQIGSAWTEYSREFTLTSNEAHLYSWTVESDVDIAVDDLRIERLDHGT